MHSTRNASSSNIFCLNSIIKTAFFFVFGFRSVERKKMRLVKGAIFFKSPFALVFPIFNNVPKKIVLSIQFATEGRANGIQRKIIENQSICSYLLLSYVHSLANYRLSCFCVHVYTCSLCTAPASNGE